MLTGCRKSEILTLRWEHVALDAAELRLPDTKTGARVISLPPMAVKLLAGLPRDPDSPWVIPGRLPGTHLRDLADAWKVIRTRAGLDDVRIHDLRHSFASRALALGESLPMIGKLLGHSQVETTARYAHLARDTVHESAARVGESLAIDLFGTDWRPRIPEACGTMTHGGGTSVADRPSSSRLRLTSKRGDCDRSLDDSTEVARR